MPALRCLNIIGLFLGTLAAVVMFYYPPVVTQYTEDGRATVAWIGDSRPEHIAAAKRQRVGRAVGPALLGLGFILQIIAASLAD